MRIVCLGDSVTRGISYVQGRLRIVKENYPALLQATLGKLIPIEVANKGVFNDNSSGLVERLDRDVLTESPSYVLIEIGGNDCNFRWDEVAKAPDSEHTAIVPLKTYIANIEHIIARIRSIDAIPVLMNLIPLDPVRYYKAIANQYGPSISHWIAMCGGIEHWHAMYNQALERIANGWNVWTIDIRKAFQQAGELDELISDDGIHPTAAGYQVMSQILREYLVPRIVQPNSP